MGTRANIIITDGNSTLFFYRHSDGYPEETGKSLAEFVKGYAEKMRDNVVQSAGWLIIHGREEYSDQLGGGYAWKVGAYEPTDSLHGDVEYIYIIDLVAKTLECRACIGAFFETASLKNTVREYVNDFNGAALDEK